MWSVRQMAGLKDWWEDDDKTYLTPEQADLHVAVQSLKGEWDLAMENLKVVTTQGAKDMAFMVRELNEMEEEAEAEEEEYRGLINRLHGDLVSRQAQMEREQTPKLQMFTSAEHMTAHALQAQATMAAIPYPVTRVVVDQTGMFTWTWSSK